MSRDWNICELIRATGLSPAIIRGPALFVSLLVDALSIYLYFYPSLFLSLSSPASSLSFRSWCHLFFLSLFLSHSANLPWPSAFLLFLTYLPEALLILMIPLYSIQKYQCYPILRKIGFNYDCQARVDPFTVRAISSLVSYIGDTTCQWNMWNDFDQCIWMTILQIYVFGSLIAAHINLKHQKYFYIFYHIKS